MNPLLSSANYRTPFLAQNLTMLIFLLLLFTIAWILAGVKDRYGVGVISKKDKFTPYRQKRCKKFFN